MTINFHAEIIWLIAIIYLHWTEYASKQEFKLKNILRTVRKNHEYILKQLATSESFPFIKSLFCSSLSLRTEWS